MKVSREQAAKNRAHVVEVAGEQFRTHGFDGIGIADLMLAAGLTHGGFYANFASKDALAAEAAGHALAETTARLRQATAGASDRLSAVADYYLSPGHRDGLAQGCVLAALAADATRGSDALRQTFEGGVEAYLDLLTPLMTGPEPRRAAMLALSSLVGALILSRTVTSDALSRDLLDAAAGELKKIPA